MKDRLDKRLFERLQVPITVKYEFPGGVIGEAVAKDISMEGACLQLPKKLDVECGTRVSLEIQIPGRNRATIIIGEIIWREKFKITMSANYDVGIRFIRVDPFDIKDTIAKLRTKVSSFVRSKSESFKGKT